MGLRRLPSSRGDPPRPWRGHMSKYRRGASKSTTHFFYDDIPYGKRRDRFGRNLEHVPRAWVPSCTRCAVPEPEASKALQFHRLSRLERVHNGLQELRDDRVCLMLRELY